MTEEVKIARSERQHPEEWSQDVDVLIIPDDPYSSFFPGQPMIIQTGVHLLKLFRAAGLSPKIDESRGKPKIVRQAALELKFPEILVELSTPIANLALSVLGAWIYEWVRSLRSRRQKDQLIADVKIGFISGHRVLSYRLRGEAGRIALILKEGIDPQTLQPNVHDVSDFQERPGARPITGFSIGALVRKSECSICGRDYYFGDCHHIWGRKYDGKICAITLTDLELVEVSLVSTPADPGARIVHLR